MAQTHGRFGLKWGCERADSMLEYIELNLRTEGCNRVRTELGNEWGKRSPDTKVGLERRVHSRKEFIEAYCC